MLRITLLLCVAVAALANEAALKKYAYIKIMSSCIGEEAMMQFEGAMKEAETKCQGDAMMEDMPSLRSYLMELREAASRPVYIPVPIYQHYALPQQQAIYYSNQFPQYTQYNQAPQALQYAYNQYQTSNRAKRGADYGKMEETMTTMQAKISNITCILKELKYLDDNNNIDGSQYTKDVMNLDVSEELKSDLMEGATMCRDFAMCLPVERAKTPLKKELGAAIAYFKCITMKNVASCMKNDLREMAAKMGREMPIMDDDSAMMKDGKPSDLFHDLVFSGGLF
ncbi:uncharacterized protein LOC122243248 [Penaeus japonicus]|uniref:uncharacterized protein LOC122243248 n=1 Tax=Penaeus japonicus TaxID=27405 RepID=UPI001C70DFF2|nr:uncharacterized protein LOC122243248 [Penaeus japonicus]